MISARVDVRDGWGVDFAREVNARVRRAVVDASEHGANVAAQIANERRRSSGTSMADIEPLQVIGTPDGWEGGFASPRFYAAFQSSGTLAARRRRVKASTLRRRESESGRARFERASRSGGIRGLGFLETGRTEARKRLVDLLNDL